MHILALVTRLCLLHWQGLLLLSNRSHGKIRGMTWLMRYRGYRVDIIVALALLTVLVLVGGQTVYRQIIGSNAPCYQDLRAVPGSQGG